MKDYSFYIVLSYGLTAVTLFMLTFDSWRRWKKVSGKK